MTATRWWAAGLMGAGLLLYALAAAPMQRQAATAADEYRRARDEARDLRTRLARLERRELAHTRVASALSSSATPGETVRVVRRSVVRTLHEAPVSAVRLGVSTARAPFAARVRLGAEGPFDEVVALAGRVAQPDTGVVLESVRLTPRGGRVALDLEAVTLGRSRGGATAGESP